MFIIFLIAIFIFLYVSINIDFIILKLSYINSKFWYISLYFIFINICIFINMNSTILSKLISMDGIIICYTFLYNYILNKKNIIENMYIIYENVTLDRYIFYISISLINCWIKTLFWITNIYIFIILDALSLIFIYPSIQNIILKQNLFKFINHLYNKSIKILCYECIIVLLNNIYKLLNDNDDNLNITHFHLKNIFPNKKILNDVLNIIKNFTLLIILKYIKLYNIPLNIINYIYKYIFGITLDVVKSKETLLMVFINKNWSSIKDIIIQKAIIDYVFNKIHFQKIIHKLKILILKTSITYTFLTLIKLPILIIPFWIILDIIKHDYKLYKVINSQNNTTFIILFIFILSYPNILLLSIISQFSKTLLITNLFDNILLKTYLFMKNILINYDFIFVNIIKKCVILYVLLDINILFLIPITFIYHHFYKDNILINLTNLFILFSDNYYHKIFLIINSQLINYFIDMQLIFNKFIILIITLNNNTINKELSIYVEENHNDVNIIDNYIN